MFGFLAGMPLVLLLIFGFVFGFVLGLLYYVVGIASLLWLDNKFAWFATRLQARDSLPGAILLTVFWPLTILGFCLSHWFRTWRHGLDPYAPKAA